MRRGYWHHRAGEVEKALALYQEVIAAYPMHPVALHYAALAGRQLNDVAKSQGKPARDDEVMVMMAASVMAAPDNAAAIHNFGKFLQDRGNLEDAQQAYETAVALNPEQGESWTNLGQIYGELGHAIRAHACWHRALECPTPTPEARFNLSFVRLMRGEWAQGWADYEARWDSITFLHGYGRGDLTAPRWDGQPLAGTLYLHGEQGAGDVLMMTRYVPLVRERVVALVLEVLEPLVPLYRATFPDLVIVARGADVPPHDAHLPMMSLPLVMGTDSPDLLPNPVDFARNRIESDGIRPEPGRIGLCWKGSPTHVHDRVRSMPYAACAPLFDVPGLTWQSLQYGEAPAPLAPLEAKDYLDTARAIARCSLVITVDTSIAHLAGSMGVPTWILLPQFAEWRWLERRSDCPWYPSARLWRQATAGDWPGLTADVARALTPFCQRLHVRDE